MDKEHKLSVIIDIYSTLADISHRLHYLEQKPKDWDAFYAAFSDDKPITASIVLLKYLVGLNILIVTGRSELYAEQTKEWLSRNGVKYDSIFFREMNDRRQDYIVKQAIYRNQIKQQYGAVLFVLEDRTQCVDMWRSEGLFTLQCTKGDY